MIRMINILLILFLVFCKPPEADIHNTGSKVEFGNTEFEGANPKGFETIGENYANDGKHVYYYDKSFSTLDWGFTPQYNYVTIKLKTDPKKFQVLGNGFAKDNKKAFYRGKSISVKDIKSFESHDELNHIAIDKFHVYYRNILIPKADPKTITVTNNSNYIKDKNFVWLINDRFDSEKKIQITKLKDADPDSFIVLDGGYAKDKAKVYYEGKIISGVTPRGFALIGTNGYMKDNTFVFYKSKKIQNADLNSFMLLELNESNKEAVYSKDNKRVYYKEIEILSANPDQFTIIEEYYSKDNSSVFFKNNKLEDANPESFLLIENIYEGGWTNCRNLDGKRYATDGNFIYYGFQKLIGADIKTFKMEPGDCAKAYDKNKKYLQDKVDH